ncbi:tandem-95 repeat protein [Novosphingobium marinum]|uniref:VCBS repeat-containing protein n=1 Tax=Novosphingobium marinum TaxID=1514948 RepID=A0A7Z0BX06_9SPHN|nr:tandem-95 repeat protein [Novosphingobium marinum]NYH96847.1 VCBS repeat-containing protein [Novosphingobium marinum]
MPPSVTVNNGLTVAAGGTATIGSGNLSFSGTQFVTVTSGVSSGVLFLDANTNGARDGGESLITTNTQFDQFFWSSGMVAYEHNGNSATSDSFTFSLLSNVPSETVSGQVFNITIVQSNAAPVVTASGGTTAFVEGANVTSTPVVVDSGVTVTDSDDASLASASVAITGGFVSGQDFLAFSNTSAATFGNISAGFNITTGVLTLTSAGATATVAQFEAALRAVTYTNNSDTPNETTRTISFSANDGSDGSNVSTQSVSVQAVNDAPTTGAQGPYTTAEDTPFSITLAQLHANDFDPEGALNGFYYGGLSNFTLTQVGNTITLTPAPNFNGTTTFDYYARDSIGASGSRVTVQINVTPVQDPPTAVSAVVFTTSEDTGTTIGLGASDPDGDTLTFSLKTGATPTKGVVVFNQSAGTFVYTPNLNANGSDSFTVEIDDGNGNVIEVPVSATIGAVNDAPVVTVPATASTNEDTPVTITGISFSDVDAGADTVFTRVSASNGVLSLAQTTGLSFSLGDGTDDGVMYIQGTITDINAAFSGLTFKPDADFNGTSQIIVYMSDYGSTGSGGTQFDEETITVTVNPVNDPPMALAAAYVPPVNENTVYGPTATFNGVSDVDGDPITIVTVIDENNVSYAVSSGSTVTLPSGAILKIIDAGFPNSFTYDASGQPGVADAFDALTAGQTDTDNWKFVYSDGTATVTIPVIATITGQNDAPILGDLDADSVTFTEGALPVLLDAGSNGTVADFDSTNFDGGTLTVSVTSGGVASEDGLSLVNGGGVVVQSAGNVSVNGTLIATITGGTGGTDLVIAFNDQATPAGVQEVVRVLGYANSAGNDPTGGDRTIGIELTDGDGGTATASTTVSVVPVNDAPEVDLNGGAAGTGTTAAYIENDVPTTIAPDVEVGDDDDTGLVSATVSITSGFIGQDALTIGGAQSGASNGIAFSYNSATGVLSLTGSASLADYQAVLASVEFSSTSDAPGTSRTVSFIVNDGTDDSAVANATVAITEINDAPQGQDALAAFFEDARFAFTEAAFGFTDVPELDAFSGVVISTLPTSGTLYIDTDGLGGSPGTPVAASQFVSKADIDAGYLVYVPVENANGSQGNFTFQVVDDGGTLNGGVNTDPTPNTFDLEIAALNDAPEGGDNEVSLEEDGRYAFAQADFNFSDPVEGNAFNSVIVTTLATDGTLYIDNDGAGGSLGTAVTAGQEVTAAQLAAGELVFVPDADENGDDYATFTFQVVDDGGDDGGFGEDTDQSPNTITIDVDAVNDAPAIGISPGVLITQPSNDLSDALNITSVVIATNFTVPFGQSLESFTVYIEDAIPNDNGVIDSFSGTLSWGIFADAGGTPGTLLSFGTDATPDVSDTGVQSTAGPYDQNVAVIDLGNVFLPAGSYWIALHEGTWDDGGDVSVVFWSLSTPGSGAPVFADFGTSPYDWLAQPFAGVAYELRSAQLEATEQVAKDLKGLIGVADVDAGGSDLTVTLEVDYGILTVEAGGSGATVVSGSGTSQVIVTGTLAELEALFASDGTSVVSYTADTDAPPATATLSLTVDDGGATGSGGALQGTASAQIAITAVNDDPTAPATNSVLTDEDAPSAAVDIGADDPDGDTLTYSLLGGSEPANGTVTFNQAAGTFVYTPDGDYNGADAFTIVIDDGNGGVIEQDVTVAVTPVNDAPVVPLPRTYTIEEDSSLGPILYNAYDPDGNILVFSITDGPSRGTVTMGASSFVYTPFADVNGIDSFDITVSDGQGGSATMEITVQIVPDNDGPTVIPGVQTLVTLPDTAIAFTVVAEDVDSETLTIDPGEPENGTITGSAGSYVYTPDDGFVGTDQIDVDVYDGEAAGDTQTVNFIVVDPGAADQWRLYTRDGWQGEVGGNGRVVGTNGFQDIAVSDDPGNVIFGVSFNGGGDIIRLEGPASDWLVGRSGSSAVFFDGDTRVEIPAGPTGTTIMFGDGMRTLTANATQVKLGEQVLPVDTLTDITAPPVFTALPAGEIDPDAVAALYVASGGAAIISGDVDINGTNDAEMVTIGYGEAEFDVSYNRGNDFIVLDNPAQLQASLSGSQVEIEGGGLDVLIPFGPGGTTIVLSDGVERTLEVVDMLEVRLGEQLITDIPANIVMFG